MAQTPRIPQPPSRDTGTPGRVQKPDKLLVAAFGDSLMWGQGVARSGRFSQLITTALGPAYSQESVLTYDRSRSGAVMVVHRGAVREEFAETFPALFGEGNGDEAAFTSGDESFAANLFGEVPATFPSVEWQIENLAPGPGQPNNAVDVALISGGANDIEFEKILNPQSGVTDFVNTYRPEIREICYVDSLNLLGQARRKMPDAVLLLFGYHLPLSHLSDLGQMTAFFKHEFDNDFLWWLNKAGARVGAPGTINIDKTVLEAQVRSVWAQSLATYEQRRAVTDANRDPAVRGPGIVFVPSGYQSRQAAFAPASLIWDSYRHPVSDPMQAERVRQAPRADLLSDLEFAYNQVVAVGAAFPWTGGPALAARLDGPRQLKQALASGSLGGDLRQLLQTEINRVRRSLIASLMHPNTDGHQLYAEMALGRHRVQRMTMTALDQQPRIPQPDPILRPQTEEPLGDLLARLSLRSTEPLAADIGHQFIDAVRVSITTSEDSDADFAADVYLVLVLKAEPGREDQRLFCQLNQRYWQTVIADRTAPSGGIHDGSGSTVTTPTVKKFFPQFEPGSTDELSVDVTGQALGPGGSRGADRRVGVPLRDLLGMRLVLGRWPVAQTWLPTQLRLDVNGVEVARRDLTGTRLSPGASVDLGWPGAAPPLPEGPPSTVVEVRADNADGNVVGGNTGLVTGP